MTTTEIPDGPVNTPPAGFYLAEAQYESVTSTLAAAGIELGEYEQGVAAWLSSWDWSTVAVIVSWVARARAAATSDTAPSVALPGRFDGTPAEVDQHLRRILADDVHLRYQQTIGGLAAAEAAHDVRMEVALPDAPDRKQWLEVADFFDPRLHGGPYPRKRQCSQHNGFGPCPGAPGCTPAEAAKDGETS